MLHLVFHILINAINSDDMDSEYWWFLYQGMGLLSRRYLHRVVRLSTLHMVDIRVQAKRSKYQMEG